MSAPRSLITGGGGFLGAHATREVLALGHEVVVLDDLSGGFRENVPEGVTFVEGSVLDHELLARLFDEHRFDYVYHLAAYAADGLSHCIERFNYQNNLVGSVNRINEAVRHAVKRFVFTSSIGVYGAIEPPMREQDTPVPEDPYGIAKLAVEQDLRVTHEMFGLDYTVFRPHNVYDEHQNLGDRCRNVVGIFMNLLMKGEPLVVFGDGEQTRAFSYVGDIAPIIARCVEVEAAGNETFNVGADEASLVNRLARAVMDAMGIEGDVRHVASRNEVAHAHSDHAKADRVFGEPEGRSLVEGLRRMAAWARTAGVRSSRRFEAIEITEKLPPVWLEEPDDVHAPSVAGAGGVKRILFAAVHRLDRSPGQRFCLEQYLPYLRDNGWDVTFSSVVTAADDRFLNAPGRYPAKAALFARAAAQRLAEARRLGRYDVVFVQREALMAGPPWFERPPARPRPRLAFDFDDAIWQDPVQRPNALLARLRNTGKTAEIVAAADLVFAGNAYLAQYARQSAEPACVRIVSTTIDTDLYVPDPAAARRDGPVCIGCSGSFSTVPYFDAATGALAEVKLRFGDRVAFKVVGDASYRNARLGAAGTAWSAATEIADLGQMDIGLMPLPDDRWTQGKCGLKGLQYMALAIPTVMSPVGVNSDIIDDGRNGLLATTDAERVVALPRLVEDAELRRRLGAAGRDTIERDYSVRRWRDVYLGEFDALAASRSGPG